MAYKKSQNENRLHRIYKNSYDVFCKPKQSACINPSSNPNLNPSHNTDHQKRGSFEEGVINRNDATMKGFWMMGLVALKRFLVGDGLFLLSAVSSLCRQHCQS